MYVIESIYEYNEFTNSQIKKYIIERIDNIRLQQLLLITDVIKTPMLYFDYDKRTIEHQNKIKVISIWPSKSDHDQFEHILMNDTTFKKPFKDKGWILSKNKITYDIPESDYQTVLNQYGISN